jgi:uncharacterized membrane protein YphA (DoxX/SURF4 family)
MMKNNGLDQTALLIGRLLLGGMYLWAGGENLTQLTEKANYAATKGVPDPALWVGLARLLLLVGGGSILTGLWPRLGVASVALFLIPVTLIMHPFWTVQGFERVLEYHSFVGNVGLLGGALLLLSIPRPWPYSVEVWVRHHVSALRRHPEVLQPSQRAS